MLSVSQDPILECHVAPSGPSAPAGTSTFGERFGYACWIFYLRAGRPPSLAAIGRDASRTGEAVSAWLSSDEAPPDFKVHAPVSTFLDVDEYWLFRGVGDPPKPALWKEWLAARRSRPSARSVGGVPARQSMEERREDRAARGAGKREGGRGAR